MARRSKFQYQFTQHLEYGEKLGRDHYIAQREEKIAKNLESMLSMLEIVPSKNSNDDDSDGFIPI